QRPATRRSGAGDDTRRVRTPSGDHRSDGPGNRRARSDRRARHRRYARTGRRARRAVRGRPTRDRRIPGGRMSTDQLIRVMLADDQDLVRVGLRVLIDSEDDLTVVGDAADGLQAVELARQLHPDVILMDVRMPGINGIEATARIVADPSLAGTRVI